MRFTDHFICRPILAAAISILLALLGWQALHKMQVREYPEVTNTLITVTTSYYGASADLIQGFITSPLEQAIAKADNIDFMVSQSQQGTSVITVHMKFNTDADAALADVLAQVNAVRAQLPKAAEDPVLDRSSSAATAVLYLGFTSDTLVSSQITDYLQRVIQPQLLTVSGVSQVQVLGGQRYALRVWLDPQKMGAFGLTAEAVNTVLQANNCQSATGQLVGEFIRYSGNAQTQVKSVEELKKLVVAAQQERVIHLEDIATVTLDKSHDRYRALVNGREAVVLAIDAAPNVNPITIASEVRQLLPVLERDLLPTLQMKVLYDTSIAINAAIHEVIKTLLEASVIVIVVIMLFLGSLRAVIIPVVTIPLSLLGVILLMQAFGFTINLMTLLAMVLAIGLVVDDAIVVVENVDRHLKAGQSPFRAAIIGTREIAIPVISMTLTLMAVYAPIALIGGLTGALFQEFALTLAGAVLISGIIALTLSPMMCAKMLTPGVASRFEQAVQSRLAVCVNHYERALQAVLVHRPVVLLFTLLIFLSIPLLVKFIPSELAPAEDRGVVVMMGTAPASANLEFIEQNMAKVSNILTQQAEVQFAQIFSGLPNSNQAFGLGAMKPWGERQASQQQVLNRITPALQSIPGMAITAFQLPELPGASLGLPVQLVIATANPFDQLYSVAEDFLAAMKASRKFIYTQLDLQYDSATVQMVIDKEKAGAYGITLQAISQTLATMIADGYINQVDLDGRAYEVVVQVARKHRMDPQSLSRYYVQAANGDPVALSHLITTQVVGMPRALPHFNQQNAATLSVVLAPGVAMGDAIAWCKATATEKLPRGYRYDFTGESRQFINEGNSLFLVFGMAVIVIFLVLAMQFESIRDPLVILISVPLSLSGALVAMAWGGATLNIYSQVGLITLVGLISKHGILICEMAKEAQLNQGMARLPAVMMAAKLRLRPILMTTAAMIAGLIPLLLSSGAGAQARFSIGLVLVVGLAFGTLFTLFVLPVIYTFLASQHKPLPKFIEQPEQDVIH